MRVERKGIPISGGIALGRVVLLDRSRMIVERKQIDQASVNSEKERFMSAVGRSKAELLSIKAGMSSTEEGDHLHILNLNIMMLEDELLSSEVLGLIETERVNAEWAVNSVLSRKSEKFRNVEDVYMKERLADIYYLGERILRSLRGAGGEAPRLGKDAVLVAHDVSAVDVVEYTKHGAMAIVTDIGASTSHSAIVAKSVGVAAVMGLEDITLRACPGDRIFVDGFSGTVILDPGEHELEGFQKLKSDYAALEKKLLDYAKLPGRTLDGREVRVNANIDLTDELGHALCFGAEGIGMYRTEFLFTKSAHFPGEKEQYESYRNVITALDSPIVTIRTLDIGGDKFPAGMEPSRMLNPALGLRGIRYSLRDVETFKTQIRAILKASASAGKKARILLPMISGISELRKSKEIISEVASGLGEGPSWAVGVMIETPSAAIMASDIAGESDFLSIGTNDLIQYTLAIDRVNEHVSYLYSPFHPALLKLITGVVDAASPYGIPVAVCGEMAGQLPCVPLLVGLGVGELSMNTHSIPKVKKLLSSITEKESKEIASASLGLKTEAEIRNFVTREVIKKWGGAIPPEFIEEIVLSS